MQPPAQIPLSVWDLLEKIYLDSADSKGKANYATLSDEEKRAALSGFADKQATVSKRWAAIVADLRAIAIAG
jgi:hypothetical protein